MNIVHRVFMRSVVHLLFTVTLSVIVSSCLSHWLPLRWVSQYPSWAVGSYSAVYVGLPQQWRRRETCVWGRARVTIICMLQMQCQTKIVRITILACNNANVNLAYILGFLFSVLCMMQLFLWSSLSVQYE